MAEGAPSPASVNADITDAAVDAAASGNRSVTEQVNYWARIGMNFDRSTVLNEQLHAVIAGAGQFSTLNSLQREVAHAILDAGIEERAAMQRFGPAARAAGFTTVAIDNDGNVIETAPDGQCRCL